MLKLSVNNQDVKISLLGAASVYITLSMRTRLKITKRQATLEQFDDTTRKWESTNKAVSMPSK